jgi:hypothetical protein
VRPFLPRRGRPDGGNVADLWRAGGRDESAFAKRDGVWRITAMTLARAWPEGSQDLPRLAGERASQKREDMTGTAQERVALVTGANRGLGLEVSRQLVEQGFRVCLGVRDLAKGAQAAKAIGSQARALELDVANASAAWEPFARSSAATDASTC